ncbi:MAG: ABC transporter permease subunit [Planctomycetes bacterium]|nr:ABC transporter permease subunit [Planctomycetota bacterium]
MEASSSAAAVAAAPAFASNPARARAGTFGSVVGSFFRQLLTLTWRELTAYFFSPMAYVILTPLLLFTGYIFFISFREASQQAGALEMRHFISLFNFLGMFVAPLLTMRLLAEEKKSGTFEMLVTAPVSDVGIVLSKYIASVLLWIFFLLPGAVYVWILKKFGANPEYGSILCNYVGLILLVGVFLAEGILFSAFTGNQIVAGISSFIALFLLYLVGYVKPNSNWAGVDWNEVFKFMSLFNHYQNFEKGVYDTRDIVYFASLIVFFLFLAVKVVESRRWR